MDYDIPQKSDLRKVSIGFWNLAVNIWTKPNKNVDLPNRVSLGTEKWQPIWKPDKVVEEEGEAHVTRMFLFNTNLLSYRVNWTRHAKECLVLLSFSQRESYIQLSVSFIQPYSIFILCEIQLSHEESLFFLFQFSTTGSLGQLGLIRKQLILLQILDLCWLFSLAHNISLLTKSTNRVLNLIEVMDSLLIRYQFLPFFKGKAWLYFLYLCFISVPCGSCSEVFYYH